MAIERQLQRILSSMVTAKYAPREKRIHPLDRANTDLEILRFQLRLATDLRALPIKSHGHAMKLVAEVGRQVGGWRRASRAR